MAFPLIVPFMAVGLMLDAGGFLVMFSRVVSLAGKNPTRDARSVSCLVCGGNVSNKRFKFRDTGTIVFFVIVITVSLFRVAIVGGGRRRL